jgi:hypothetical protein
MAIRIIADAMTLEIENHVVATTRVGEHAEADGKWGMGQVGRGDKRLQQSGLVASPAGSGLPVMLESGSTARLTPWFRSRRACVAPAGLRIASSGAVECDVHHAMAAYAILCSVTR